MFWLVRSFWSTSYTKQCGCANHFSQVRDFCKGCWDAFASLFIVIIFPFFFFLIIYLGYLDHRPHVFSAPYCTAHPKPLHFPPWGNLKMNFFFQSCGGSFSNIMPLPTCCSLFAEIRKLNKIHIFYVFLFYIYILCVCIYKEPLFSCYCLGQMLCVGTQFRKQKHGTENNHTENKIIYSFI